MTEATAPWRAVSPTSEPLIVGGTPADAAHVSDAPQSDLPAVVAVVVIQHPDAELASVLGSIAAQDYENLSVLVIDSSNRTDVLAVAADLLPDAFVHRTSPTPGFAAAANQARELVSGAAFLLFCHDDVALDAHCVTQMVEEMYRSNAGIVSPKLLQWDDPRKLLRIGMGSDRFGSQTNLVDPGEFDQEQYDAVGDVFIAPGGVQLVRADLFEALDGFDAAMGGFGEDLDFCWRAHVVGARVVAVPSASARRADLERKSTHPHEVRRKFSRNRLRTLLVVSSRGSLLRVVPVAVLLLIFEGLFGLLTGRRQRASAAFGAIGHNITHLGQIRKRRKALKKIRSISDAEVHALQARGSARLTDFFRGSISGTDGKLAAAISLVRRTLAGQNAWITRDVVVVFVGVGLFVLFGSRGLLLDETVSVGQMPRLPGWRALTAEWWGDYRSSGLGGEANAPTSFLVLGAARLAFFWWPRLLDVVLVVGPFVLGLVGAWRLGRPLKNGRAAALAMATYSLSPLVPSAYAAARWDALVVYAAAPFLLLSALRLARVAPFNAIRRSEPALLVRYGFVTAVFATFVPAVVVVAIVTTVGVGIGGLVTDRSLASFRRFVTSLLGGVAAVLGAGALHAPYTFDILRNFRWGWLMGPASPEELLTSFSEIMLFAPGRFGASLLTYGIFAGAVFALLVGRGDRFLSAVRAWTVTLTAFMVVWFGSIGAFSFELPAWEIMLTPAAAGLALAVGIGVQSITTDLPGYGYGWRQFAAVLAGSGLLCLSFLGLTRAVDGRWNHPTNGFGESAGLLTASSPDESRVLWLGDPRVLPLDAHTSPDGLHYAITDGGLPDIRDRQMPAAYGMISTIGEYLDIVVDGESVRLGRLLAPLGVEYVVVVSKLAPAPYIGPTFDPGSGVEDALINQLDLKREFVVPDLLVFQNTASRGAAVALDPATDPGATTVAELLEVDFTSGASVPLRSDGPNRFVSSGAPGTGSQTVAIAVPADGWTASGDATVRSGVGGIAVLDVVGGERFVLERSTPIGRRLAQAAQLAIILSGLVIASSRVRTPLRPAGPDRGDRLESSLQAPPVTSPPVKSADDEPAESVDGQNGQESGEDSP